MVEWHHWLNGHEFEQALGGSEGQVSLVFCSPWDCKESDTTEQCSNNKQKFTKPKSSEECNSISYVNWTTEAHTDGIIDGEAGKGRKRNSLCSRCLT